MPCSKTRKCVASPCYKMAGTVKHGLQIADVPALDPPVWLQGFVITTNIPGDLSSSRLDVLLAFPPSCSRATFSCDVITFFLPTQAMLALQLMLLHFALLPFTTIIVKYISHITSANNSINLYNHMDSMKILLFPYVCSILHFTEHRALNTSSVVEW